MGFIEKLKLLFKVRQPATDLINEVKGIKAGYKTLPFWITIIGTLSAAIAALNGVIPATAALIAGTILTAFYNILRGATKTDVQGTKPVLQTTEFWMGVLSTISNSIVAIQAGGVNPAWFIAAQSILGAAMAAGQNLAGQQPGTGAPVVLPNQVQENKPAA